MRRYHNRIINKINRYQVISFDIFDTLIKRNIRVPTDVFDIVEKRYNSENCKRLKNFKKKRISAEIESQNYAQDGEPSLSDIYKELNISDKERLEELEIKTERAICQRNLDFYHIYEYAKRKGKKIVVTSDMYLPENVIRKILYKENIDFDVFLLSNVVKKNKHTGSIFPYLVHKLNVSPRDILHIGDSKRGDFIKPKMHGIHTVLIPKHLNKLRYYKEYEIKKLDDNLIVSFLNNNIPKDKSIYFQIGYELLGVVLLGYVKWVTRKLETERIDKVFFLSREGALLKKAFDLINLDSSIESRYLYVSRKSTRCVFLKSIATLDDVFKVCKMRRVVSVTDFFANVNLDVNNYHDLLEKYNCQKDTNIKSIPNFEEMFQEIKNDINLTAQEQENNLVSYLRQERFNGKIAICDVGWEGSMQKALFRITRENHIKTELFGFYMGLTSPAYENIKHGLDMNGYLFNYDSKNAQYIKYFLNLFESFFLADHGTTLGYKAIRGKIEPILDKYEYTGCDKQAYFDIQTGALSFIKNFLQFENEIGIEIEVSPELATYASFMLGLHPTNKDIKLFGKLEYVETNMNKFASPRNIIYYLFHPGKLYIDFSNCSWKIGFLKKLFGFNISPRILDIIYRAK